MKTAILTGASRGIGLALSGRLLMLGYRVYGIARNFEGANSLRSNFIQIKCDLLDTDSLVKIIDGIKEREETIDLLINNAGTGYFGPHEQLKTAEIKEMARTNFEVPLIISNLLLRDLKKSKGTMIFISSVTAKKISTHGCAYAATKAGISHFAESLFEEIRKAGVKVTVIHPDMTKTHFYDKLDFTFEDTEGAYINDNQVADAVAFVLKSGDNMTVNDITLRPQFNRIRRK